MKDLKTTIQWSNIGGDPLGFRSAMNLCKVGTKLFGVKRPIWCHGKKVDIYI